MCRICESDPRDAIAQGERALLGLRVMVGMVPPGEDIPVNVLGPLLDIIHDRIELAVEDIQNYVPRS